MDTALRIAGALVAGAALAGCAAPAGTHVMGAAPECDLHVQTRNDHRCAVRRVTPPDAHAQLTHSMRRFEAQTLPR